jgi:hypothetical protein
MKVSECDALRNVLLPPDTAVLDAQVSDCAQLLRNIG